MSIIIGVNDNFARRQQVPPASHTPTTEPETPVQRMYGLIKQGWPRDSIVVHDSKLMLVRRESHDMIPL